MSGQLLASACRPAFSRHETFHPRFGWLRKAFTATCDSPQIFAEPDATVRLGVGKNMVHAIRYWGQAFKVITEAPNPDRPRLPLLVPTAFGEALLGDDGWDPFLEDPASLWLLHWKLLEPTCLAPTWWVAFHDFELVQFGERQLVEQVVAASAGAGWPAVVEGSVKKDVDCLLRCYTVRRQGRQTLDDTLDCPFRELGLIEPAAQERGAWRFVSGEKTGLSDAVIAHACLDYLTRSGSGASISVARLSADPGSPGRAFRLPEATLYGALQRAALSTAGLTVAEPAGVRQLLVDGDPADLAAVLLAEHYGRHRMREVMV